MTQREIFRDQGKGRLSLCSADAPRSLIELACRPTDRVAGCDLARVNLLCAQGLPGAEGLDVEAALRVVDGWAMHAQRVIDQHEYQFEQAPGSYRGSKAYWRVLTLTTVLQLHMRVRYNPQLFDDPEAWIESDARDLFIHGLLGPRRVGTCASLPVLIVVIGRRLGWPMRLVRVPEHLFCRWDDEETGERWNIECHGSGLVCHDDAHYRRWPRPWPECLKALEATRPPGRALFLRSLEPAEEVAGCFVQRALCLLVHGRHIEASLAFKQAARLVPDHPHYTSEAEWLMDTGRASARVLQPRWYDPAAGVFNRLDPFVGDPRDPVSLNKHQYTHADPVSGIDPTGLSVTQGTGNFGGFSPTGAIDTDPSSPGLTRAELFAISAGVDLELDEANRAAETRRVVGDLAGRLAEGVSGVLSPLPRMDVLATASGVVGLSLGAVYEGLGGIDFELDADQHHGDRVKLREALVEGINLTTGHVHPRDIERVSPTPTGGRVPGMVELLALYDLGARAYVRDRFVFTSGVAGDEPRPRNQAQDTLRYFNAYVNDDIGVMRDLYQYALRTKRINVNAEMREFDAWVKAVSDEASAEAVVGSVELAAFLGTASVARRFGTRIGERLFGAGGLGRGTAFTVQLGVRSGSASLSGELTRGLLFDEAFSAERAAINTAGFVLIDGVGRFALRPMGWLWDKGANTFTRHFPSMRSAHRAFSGTTVEGANPGAREWLRGRYVKPASRPNAYWDSGQKVFPTRRNSGLNGAALRGEQTLYTVRQLSNGRSLSIVHGQALEAGLAGDGANVLLDRGAQKAIDRAVNMLVRLGVRTW